MLNKYALTIVLRNDLEEKERKELLDSTTKKFGKLLKEDLWGARDLAYPIQHQTKGYYAHYEFEGEPNSVSPIDRSLKIDENVLRYLLVRI
jgi:small subunit ribosomal protein S6